MFLSVGSIGYSSALFAVFLSFKPFCDISCIVYNLAISNVSSWIKFELAYR